ncbi:MAG: YeeE/YedE family protein [Alphaproteobacteria bacterium]|nr:YeeE/YedE family protein [Alphaproteobacteria bacterium]
MEGTPGYVAGLLGLVIGLVIGYAARRAKLCTFAAIEDAAIGGDHRRMKVFAAALAVAIVGTQSLVAAGLLEPRLTPYVPAAWPWASALAGGLLFGMGMALVGTCAFGSLVRLGGGDLRSLVVLLVFGLVAQATLRGVLAPVRTDVLDRGAVSLPSLAQGDVAAAVDALGLPQARLVSVLAIGGLLLLWALADPRLRRVRRLVVAGATVGLCILAGWIATAVLPDPLDTEIRPQSLNFVAPVARAIATGLMGQGVAADFGVASVLGVVIGAALAARSLDELRWEAFDDPREMRRHLLGAGLMGFGGVLAGGCTIGQGMTAASLLALSAPVAIAGMIIGARLGIFILVEGVTVKALLGAVSPGARAD